MRDLTSNELGFVYGAGGCGKPAKPVCSTKGSRGKDTKSCGTRGKGTKSRSKGSSSKGRCGC